MESPNATSIEYCGVQVVTHVSHAITLLGICDPQTSAGFRSLIFSTLALQKLSYINNLE